MALLEIEHLSVSFTRYAGGLKQIDVQPITELQVSVEAGEIVAVVGSSGSGKSLLAHAVLGILPENAKMSGIIRRSEERRVGKEWRSRWSPYH